MKVLTAIVVSVVFASLALAQQSIPPEAKKHLDTLAARFESGTVVTPELLKGAGLIGGLRRPVKVLARGDIGKKLTVRAHKFSGKAAEKIAAAGGAAEVLGAS